MSRHDFNTRFFGSVFLEEQVIGLQVQHAGRLFRVDYRSLVERVLSDVEDIVNVDDQVGVVGVTCTNQNLWKVAPIVVAGICFLVSGLVKHVFRQVFGLFRSVYNGRRRARHFDYSNIVGHVFGARFGHGIGQDVDIVVVAIVAEMVHGGGAIYNDVVAIVQRPSDYYSASVVYKSSARLEFLVREPSLRSTSVRLDISIFDLVDEIMTSFD